MFIDTYCKHFYKYALNVNKSHHLTMSILCYQNNHNHVYPYTQTFYSQMSYEHKYTVIMNMHHLHHEHHPEIPSFPPVLQGQYKYSIVSTKILPQLYSIYLFTHLNQIIHIHNIYIHIRNIYIHIHTYL
jgi:hypothetical protein